MNFKSIILSTAYLPPIEYFVYILNAEEIYLEQYEYYVKQSYRNRCYIYGPNGKQTLSIPVIKSDGNKTLIKDVLVSIKNEQGILNDRWQMIHWRSIETAYNSSPYFLYYRDDISKFYDNKIDSLFNYNFALLKTLMKLIGFDKEINFTVSYDKVPADIPDLRNKISPKADLIAGFPEYTQVFSNKNGFLPNLSIIDLLFNEGPCTIDYLRSCESEVRSWKLEVENSSLQLPVIYRGRVNN